MTQLISQIDGIDEVATKNLKDSLKNLEIEMINQQEAERTIIVVME